jgi:hypothetical protein
MKRKFPLCFLGLLAIGSASAQGLYYVGSEAQESLPLKWVVGTTVTYDDNVNAGSGPAQNSMSINPYVGLTFVSVSPQTTWDVYARLGLIYYLDAPAGMDDMYSQSRAGINLTHRFSERLRFSSRNFISYEMEPEYSYGYASSRVVGEYLYWQTDNSLGFRWTERFATYTGVRLTGLEYPDADYNNRLTWEIYNQCRYQLSPQTVLTFDARYSETSGDGGAAGVSSSDYNDQYYLIGAEHRFNATTIGIIRAGIQLHSVDDGTNNYTSPYVEFALNSQINQQFSVRAYARYGIEGYDSVQNLPVIGLVEYDDRQTLRFGVSGEYAISPMFSIFGGVDYMPSSYASGRDLQAPFVANIPDMDEDIINAYIGLSVKFNQMLTGTLSYNYTTSSSDIKVRDYDRNRISLGLSAEF